MRKPVLPCANNKGVDQPAHPRSLNSTFVVRCLDSIINQVGHPQSATKFHDFSLTEFYFSLTKILSFYGLFLFLQPINDKLSLCSSPILQFKKKKKKCLKSSVAKMF